ncbi:unnamed protein product [Macrosiphum euphorbiae]|uniref:Uncharacterized protein n=1 Tax=Macrosiphum euphorbiae TaxID=13131 RepID=A0AAV0VX76_9HEMI|nr:unnamed protein product [Macrosiphum euphorbiae]
MFYPWLNFEVFIPVFQSMSLLVVLVVLVTAIDRASPFANLPWTFTSGLHGIITFLNAFRKFSDKNAYNIGFRHELVYARQWLTIWTMTLIAVIS